MITGGAGFIGSHLSERLLSEGKEIICVDNFYTGSKKNIEPFLGNANYEFIRHSVWLPLYVEVGNIFNLACPASPVHYQSDPVGTMKTSVLGAINMLGLAKRQGSRVLQASTSEVYGDPTTHPQDEEYWGNVNPIGKRACYDEGKRCAEAIFFDYRRQYDVDIRIARIFNTYGPKMHPQDGRVVSNFITQALQGLPITIYGPGTQTRSFCYIDDLVDGLISLMNNESEIGPVNLGNTEEVEVLKLAELIISLTNSDSEIEFHPLPSDDPARRKPDISKAKTCFDWAPKTKLESGLVKTINYFEDYLRKPE